MACLLVILSALPSNAEAATCGLYRDLGVGSSGEDVRCLQQYLNENYLRARGYVIDASGVYTGQTQQAIIWWQQSNGISPATGFFGALSRSHIGAIMGYGVPATNQYQYQNQYAVGNDSQEALARILNALDTIHDTEDEIDDSNKSTAKAKNLLNTSREELINAIQAFFDHDYDEALDRATEADELAEDAIDAIDGSVGNRKDAEDLIDDVEESIDDAWEDVRDADDDGDDVDESEDILRDAKDVLDDAREALDDRDYDEAEDFANDADDLVDEALDALGDNNHNDIEERLDDAWDALSDARDDLDDAIDDDEYVGDAEDLLDDAEDALNDAEDELDNGDEDDAKDRIEEAEELIDEALYEF